MAISTLDGLIAGLQPPENFQKLLVNIEAVGILHSLLYTDGTPGKGTAPAPGLAGAALTSYAGQLPYNNPSSGNGYLARFSGVGQLGGTLIVADRLWHNSGITITQTTAQTVNSVAWPARDRDGSTNGEGVLVGIEVSTATGNGSPVTNTTMSYTDQSNGSPKTATIPSFPSSAQIGVFVPFALAAGDRGVRSIQSLTLGTSYVSGTIHLVAYRPLARIGLPVANVEGALDAIAAGFPRLYDNTVPFLLWLPTSTTGNQNIGGQFVYAHG